MPTYIPLYILNCDIKFLSSLPHVKNCLKMMFWYRSSRLPVLKENSIYDSGGQCGKGMHSQHCKECVVRRKQCWWTLSWRGFWGLPPRSTVADYKTNDSVNTFDAAGIASPQHRDYDLHKSYKLTTGSKYKVHDQKISEREYLYLLLINTFKQTRDRHL